MGNEKDVLSLLKSYFYFFTSDNSVIKSKLACFST